MAAEPESIVQNETCRKPYKVSGKGSLFTGIVASSLDELKVAASNVLKLPFVNDLKVFLHEDLTEVDNDEYFQFLPAQTKLIVLQQEETASFGLGHVNPQEEICLSLRTTTLNGLTTVRRVGFKLRNILPLFLSIAGSISHFSV